MGTTKKTLLTDNEIKSKFENYASKGEQALYCGYRLFKIEYMGACGKSYIVDQFRLPLYIFDKANGVSIRSIKELDGDKFKTISKKSILALYGDYNEEIYTLLSNIL